MEKGWDSVSILAAGALAFRGSSNISGHPVWAAAIQLKTSYRENVKGKDSFASFSGHPSPLTFLLSAFISQGHQMPNGKES